jgi:hypothetical protein
MLYRFDQLEGTALHARDGTLGKVKDIYFDDRDWKIRYFVADTGGWFRSRKVLLSPAAIERFDSEENSIHVDLSKQQIEDSPPIGTEEPVSRKMEAMMAEHYRWPAYWALPSTAMDAPILTPSMAYPSLSDDDPERREQEGTEVYESGLRSSDEVKGYGLRTPDGSIGHVDGFLCDPETWSIRYLIVDTRRILPGKRVLIPPSMIQNVSWKSGDVVVATTVERIQSAHEYKDSQNIEPHDETEILRHYGRGADEAKSMGRA